MASVDNLAQAIARYEGYYSTGSVAQRNNNPGNLRSWGNNPVVGGFAQFPTAETGWVALRSQVQRNIDRGLTLDEFFAGKPGTYSGYAPSADNNRPLTYAATVANWLGISPGVQLSDAIGGAEPVQEADVFRAAAVPVSAGVPVSAALAVGVVSLGWLLFARG